jgi:N-acetylgalactosamine-N,N'-diacetylbacillosaminyl-diphospho-undecaprenol 4-alpha-N-acetylgalactosaminyltransferase
LAALRLKKYCQANGIELVFSLLNRPNFTACMAKLAGLRLPLMMNECTNTQLWFDEGDLRGKIAKRIVSFLYPQADIILPISEGNRRSLEEYYGIKTRYQVITNVVDLADIEEKKLEPVDNVNFERFTFINLASFSPMKGHRVMVDAFKRLGRDDVQLVFVGKGVHMEEIRDLVHSMGLEKNILFPGFQRNPFKYLGKSDCFVFASDYEGQGAVLMEAMACGLPVISTDCESGPRDLLAPGTNSKLVEGQTIEYGQYGVLVPVGNAEALSHAMLEIFDNIDLREQYRNRVNYRVKAFDGKLVVGQIRSLINEFLGQDIRQDPKLQL